MPMRICLNLPDNLEELGALQSLLPNKERLVEMGVLGEGRRKPRGKQWPTQTLKTITERFMSKVEKKESGCWMWTGSGLIKGYGHMHCLLKHVTCHRLSWMINIGKIPDGLCVLHKCDNRRCVNPDHLFLGTNKDNQDDCRKKGRHAWLRGERLPLTKLTAAQAFEAKQRLKSESFRSIARDMGVHFDTIRAIKRGQSWAWLTSPNPSPEEYISRG